MIKGDKIMDFNTYQRLARRTQNVRLSPNERLEHALFGLAAETGEIHSIFQKIHQGHAIQMSDLIGEMGDLMWFVSELADVHHMTLDEIAESNINKLRKRYPDGFDAEHSLHREE